MSTKATDFVISMVVLAIVSLVWDMAAHHLEQKERRAACGPCVADSDAGAPVGTLCGELVCTKRDGWR